MGAALGLALGAGFQGCSMFEHYSGGVPGIPTDGRWAQLPVGRWLTEPGIMAQGIAFCRAATCDEPGFVAVLRLSGPDARLARQIADNPEAVLTRKPEPRWRQVSPRAPAATPRIDGPTRITRLSQLPGWQGASVELAPRAARGRSAYVVVLARTADSLVVIAAAETREAAQRLAITAIR